MKIILKCNYLTIVLTFLISNNIFAQMPSFCGTSVSTQSQAFTTQLSSTNQKDHFTLRYVPMQVHMVLNDNGGSDMGILKVRESICTLNKDFENTGFQFYMEKDIHYIISSIWNDHTFDQGEEMMRQNNVDNVINVYLVNNPAGNCGYYTYRGDAVALSKSCTGKSSHTWAHEFGHYFSLPHTFFGWEGISYSQGKPTSEFQNQVMTTIENIDRNNCHSSADNFCDTPPDYISVRWSCNDTDSSLTVQKDIAGESFRSDGTLFMSYAIDNCMSRFSNEQMIAMQSNIENRRTDLMRNINPLVISSFDNEQITPLDSSFDLNGKIHFSWNKLDNADYYIIQISRNQIFSVIIKNISTKENYIDIDSLQADKKFYWRVIPINNFDFCQQGSKYFTFTTAALTSVNNISNRNFDIYPNPIHRSEKLHIHTVNSFPHHKVKIFSNCGVDITFNTNFQQNSNNIDLDVNKLSSGIYFISIDNQFYKLSIID